ncbi:MAG: acyl-CoA desaturase [Sphingobacteriales bacterium]|nr:MAG: acyl-CoA desaturase [Sphingobacteriales bacterium]
MAVLIFFFAHHYISLFFQTFFQHRYAAHGAFKMSKGWERAFYVMTWLAQGSSYLSPRAYAVMHRIHHAYTDTDKDPHSPSYSTGLMDMMIKTWRYYSSIYTKTRQIDPRFTKNVPDWPAFDRFAHELPARLIHVAAYVAFYAYFATAWWMYLLLPIHILLSPVHGAIINWFAHKYGYENYKMKNTSENLLHVDFLMLGESYHNNHHKHASSPNFGVKWHELDPVYPFILLFDKLGIIHITKNVPHTAISGHNRLLDDLVAEEEMAELEAEGAMHK